MTNQNDATAQFYDTVSKSMKPSEITAQEVKLVQSILDPESTILDIGCATGRHSVPLLSLGYKVYGVEESEEMLNTLKEKTPPEFRDNFVNENVYELEPSVKFDLITMFWNTFNEVALSDLDAEDLIKKLDSLLNVNGMILINSDDPETWAIENYSYGYETEINGTPAEYSWEATDLNKETNVTTFKETVILKNTDEYGAAADEVFETEIKQRWYKFSDYEKLFQKFGYKIERKKISGNSEMYILAQKN